MPIHAIAETLFDWLVDGAPGASTPGAVLARLGPDLVQAGVPIARMAAFVRTLHPNIMGRRFVWRPGVSEVEAVEAPISALNAPAYLASPVAQIFASGAVARVRLGPDAADIPEDLQELAREGHTDWVGFPLRFLTGSVHAITFSTAAPDGFTEEQIAHLAHVVRPLARVAETMALMRTAVNLLDAYVGNDAGDRILRGQIQRGDVETIRAVIWFSDLRGFTSMSGGLSPVEIIAVLNAYFECQVAAIDEEGGQVLKFIGDGLLAIFPIRHGEAPATAGDAAIRATSAAFSALETLNASREGRGEAPLAFGVALHLGEVAYGNTGGPNRLDFTAIGPAVNLASRIEGLTGKLGRAVLLSAELAAEVSIPTRSLGSFELKGIGQAAEVFEPA